MEGTKELHPLARSWTFWVDDFAIKNASMEEFEKNLKTIGTCHTIEGFWNLFGTLPSIELLQDKKITIHFMENGVKPLWEDKKNIKGGTITVKCPKEETAIIWKELLVLVISNKDCETIHKGKINGVSVSMKKANNLIGIWVDTKDSNFKDNVIKFIVDYFPVLDEGDVGWKENAEHITDNQI
ncbi:eukaryotic translation initiation factor 4E type, putative [Entamoeba invadens IP1]|uniref:eukaryotic translation initiation factor 4E type, putative n=1 Tax=Entamoeba invadens IP1 TaxID=370355 RepID=UPI0002C3D713|nr:eukaryotic translation initiation factor 4E type, putative [Entamoeba invadens IP1]ELP93546.1 eukaryotic translation initiation factor 4E type, putative [Entamoeba invadens IP1]|eukprot:XP_004260317.1 eukaryotic translation initiation factor 4E type, putative [Entamoeba invadens IP1]